MHFTHPIQQVEIANTFWWTCLISLKAEKDSGVIQMIQI